MPIGLLFWILAILTVLAYFFATAWPFVSFGMLLLLICILGVKVFGKPIQG